jgi:L-alanine-DL-glutamate epimerase-like enolase superfamily enzyme
MNRTHRPLIDSVRVSTYVVPTDAPESDGTAEWHSTTIVIASVHAADAAGLGYTYADAAAATFVTSVLAPSIVGRDALETGAAVPERGAIRPDRSRPGLGLELKRADVERYRTS